MKIIFFLIIFIIQFVINFASADVKKFLGDPNPVDHVFDCINPEEKFEKRGLQQIGTLKEEKSIFHIGSYVQF